LSAIAWRSVAPVFVILVGGVILLGALTSQSRDSN
jgi:hypothetical protein